MLRKKTKHFYKLSNEYLKRVFGITFVTALVGITTTLHSQESTLPTTHPINIDTTDTIGEVFPIGKPGFLKHITPYQEYCLTTESRSSMIYFTPCDDHDNKQWVRTSDNQLRHVSTNKCFNIEVNHSRNSRIIYTDECSDTSNQILKFTKNNRIFQITDDSCLSITSSHRISFTDAGSCRGSQSLVEKRNRFIFEPTEQTLQLKTSIQDVLNIFSWAKPKALSWVQTGKLTNNIPNIPSYWAAYDQRSAFYGRDFAHQAIGAHLLGLREENYSMTWAFANSQTSARQYYPVWALDFTGNIYDLDYKGDHEFVREIPFVYELVETVEKLYRWTGDQRYLNNQQISLYTDRVMQGDFLSTKDRNNNGIADAPAGRVWIWTGAASYNEHTGGGERAHEASDGFASQYRATQAYTKLQKYKNEPSQEYIDQTNNLLNIFNSEWVYEDGRYIMGKEIYNNGNYGSIYTDFQRERDWFIHYKGLAQPSERQKKHLRYINDYTNRIADYINIEALTYVPDVYFNVNQPDVAWDYMKKIYNRRNQQHSAPSEHAGNNGNYPEVSFTAISHIVTGLMGVNTTGYTSDSQPSLVVETLPKLANFSSGDDWIEVDNISIQKNRIKLRHDEKIKTTFTNYSGDSITWRASFFGSHDSLQVNGTNQPAQKTMISGTPVSYVTVHVPVGETHIVNVPNITLSPKVEIQEPESRNLLQDGGFEKGGMGWLFTNGGVAHNCPFNGGALAQTSGDTERIYTEFSNLTPGVYKITARALASCPNGKMKVLDIRSGEELLSTDIYHRDMCMSRIKDDDQTLHTGQFTIENPTTVRIEFNSCNGWINIDDVTLTRIRSFQSISPDDNAIEQETSAKLVNIAQNKKTSQSSVYGTSYSHIAVDGIVRNTVEERYSTHTQRDFQAWWEVDLGKVHKNIREIRLHNRGDTHDRGCCANRLTDFHIFISDVPFTGQTIAHSQAQEGVIDIHESGQAGHPSSFYLETPQSGRYIRVQLSNTNFLHFNELEVFADEENIRIVGDVQDLVATEPLTTRKGRIDLRDIFTSPEDISYTATSSDPEVAQTSIQGDMLTITTLPVLGFSRITIWAKNDSSSRSVTVNVRHDPSDHWYDWQATKTPEKPYKHAYHQSLVVKMFQQDKESKIVNLNFEEILDRIERLNNITPSIHKIVYLVGWQYNGHDTGYPSWSIVNPRLKRDQDETAAQSLRWLMREARSRFNTTVSLHINMLDIDSTSPSLSSPLRDEYIRQNIARKYKDGSLWAYQYGIPLSYTKEWRLGKAQERIDELVAMLPELKTAGTIHIDAYLQFIGDNQGQAISPYLESNEGITIDEEAKTMRRTLRYWRDKHGIDVTTEYSTNYRQESAYLIGLQPMAWHMQYIANVPPSLYVGTPMKAEQEIRHNGLAAFDDLLIQFAEQFVPWYFDNNASSEQKSNAINIRHHNTQYLPMLWMDNTWIFYSLHGFNGNLNAPQNWQSVTIRELSTQGIEKEFMQSMVMENQYSINAQAGRVYLIEKMN